MKFTTLLIFCFQAIGCLVAQSFETYLRTATSDKIYHAAELENGNFLLIGNQEIENYKYNHKPSKSLICLMDPNGTILDTKLSTEVGFNNLKTSWNFILPYDQDLILFGTEKDQLHILRLTQSLDTVWQKYFGTNTLIENPIKAICDKNNNIVVIGNSNPITDTVGFAMDIFMYKISASGDSIFSKYFVEPGFQYSSDILETVNNGYYLFNWGMPDYKDTTGQFDNILAGNIAVLDSVGNIDSIKHMIIGTDPFKTKEYYTTFSAKWLTDTTFVFASTFLDMENHNGDRNESENIVVDIWSDSFQINSSHAFGAKDTTDHAANLYSLDFLYPSAIFVGGFSNSEPTNFGSTNSFYRLLKMDSTGKVIWEKTYQNTHYNILNSIMATSDSGCLLMGSTFDYETNQANEYDAWIIKVGPDGNLTTGITENELAPEDFIVYPNPTSDELTIRVPNSSETTVTIYDNQGKFTLKQTFSIQTKLDLTQFPNGLFIYELITSDGKVGRGKIVKN
jgi:hypothetical protein